MQVFDYISLSPHKNQIIQGFHDKGFIAIRGVPGFVKAYEDFIDSAQKFISLPEERRAQCTPHDFYSRGWSFGIEKYHTVNDAYKGSYYVKYPEDHANALNLWPSQDVSDFKKHYLKLVEIIFQMGKEIKSLFEVNIEDMTSLARMLYYGPIHDPKAVEWCAEHRDHSFLTGLCPGVYFYKGQKVPPPPKTGLFVRGEEVLAPDDALLFQIGETAELITNGVVIATEHEVRKAIGGYERYSLALFMDPLPDYVMESTLTKYNDRFTSGMCHREWHQRTFKKYYDNVAPS